MANKMLSEITQRQWEQDIERFETMKRLFGIARTEAMRAHCLNVMKTIKERWGNKIKEGLPQ